MADDRVVILEREVINELAQILSSILTTCTASPKS